MSIYLPLSPPYFFLIRAQLFRYGKTPVNLNASILEINAREVIFFIRSGHRDVYNALREALRTMRILFK